MPFLDILFNFPMGIEPLSMPRKVLLLVRFEFRFKAKTTILYPSDLVNTKTTIPLRVGEELRVSEYIHHYSLPLRGIVVY